jgi:alkanesulfonate monooxygenase SsuD/methylene tetrahydromethanopterin reductase-like flavin-dependent oxidoreductase (luciferase family)
MNDIAAPPKAAPLNRMRQSGTFKLGLFGYLHEGANAITTVPERWPARWDDIIRMSQLADDAGLDFLLPIARWKGIPGEVNNRLHSFETLTHAATLAAVTKHIGVFATVHTPIVHPIVAAKSIVTIDHASHGRAGLNIVCGWNQADFDMFGFQQLAHDERYVQGGEWYDIWSRLVAGAPAEFDYDGKYFHGRGIGGMPAAVQQPQPLVMSAGYSPAGRDYAVRVADYFLTSITDPEHGRRELADLGARARQLNRTRPVNSIAVTYVVCRETRAEAEAFHRYYAEEYADHKGVDYYLAGRKPNADQPERLYQELRLRWAGGNGGVPLVGAPEDVAEGLIALQRAGFAGAALCFLHFLDDLPFFVDRVLPLLAQAGLRTPH